MPELSESFLLTKRLDSLHENMDSCRAVTVCAPAGYGKTTLAVSYLNRTTAIPSRICWYRLDPEDRNLLTFVTHLIEALFPPEAAEFTESRNTLLAHSENQSQTYRTSSMICQEMWAHHRDDARTYIILDDFQHAAQVDDICGIVRFLLNNLPPSCAIFILSRANLHVFSEKQKLEKKVLEIGADDLAFNKAEIRALMVRMGKTTIDRKMADIIEETTEGWIAGIIILWQAFKSKGYDTAAIEPGMLTHIDALFRYMSLEVLKSVERGTQDALARLALLQDFSEAEASEILEVGDIKSLMEQCIGFGMFIQRIPGVPVVYRFHSLFREFLLSILRERCSDELIAELHLKAAGYYMRNETYGRTAEHLAKSGSSASATEMVTQAGFNKFMIGETGQLKMWLDLLPEDVIRDNPVLLLFKAQLMPNSRQPEMIDTLKEVLHLSLLDNDLATYYDAASVLIYIFMCSNNMKGLLEMTEGLPERRQDVSVELRNTLLIIDMVRSIAKDRFDLAEKQSESVLYDLLPEDSKWLYLILSCIIYYCLGKLDQGERCMETALILEKFKKSEPSRGFVMLFLSIILSLKNERALLPSYIDEIIATGRKYDYEYLSAHGNRLAAFERYLSFDVEASVKMLDDAAFLFLRINNKAMAAALRLLRLLWKVQPSSPPSDLEEARQDLAVIRETNPGLMVPEVSLSVLGAVARESGDFQLAESCLLESIEAAKAKKGNQVLCGSYFHIAKLYYAGGDAEQGHHYLKQAMELAAANRYFIFWDIHLPTLLEMALRSIRCGYCPGYAEELLGKYYDSKIVMYLIQKVKILEEDRIAAFVYEFVSTYKGEPPEQLYLVKASLFGTPEISINGIKIPDTEWKTKKVKGFLEYLLLSSRSTVSKEVLQEIFWPGSDSKSAVASQRTALYHLRKTLSKYGVEVKGDNAFLHETKEGLQIRANDGLELDVHEFLRLSSELSLLTARNRQTEEKQLALLERMISLYKGDLMEGSDYGDLVFHERERFRSIFIDACQKISSIYMKNGELGQAEEILKRALTSEPYNENVCLELLKLYMSQGRKSKASKLYYSFKKLFEQELGIKIDKRLTEAIRSPGTGGKEN